MLTMRALRQSSVLLAALVTTLVGCGSQSASSPVTDPETGVDRLRNVDQLPPDAEFVLNDGTNLAVPVDDNLPEDSRLERLPLTAGNTPVSCDELGKWAGFKVPAVSEYNVACGVKSPTGGLPDRHGKTAPNGEPLEYTLFLTYLPVDLDQSAVANTAYAAGAVSVRLYYSQDSWNGKPTKTEKSSDPGNKQIGGWAVGKVHKEPAIVQRRDENVTRVSTVVKLRGDVFSLSAYGWLPPEGMLTFVSDLDIK